MKSDFRDDMRPSFRQYYEKNIRVVQEALQHVLPDSQTVEFPNRPNIADADLILNSKIANDALYRPMKQYLKTKGKLFRPILCSMILEAYNEDPMQFKPILAIPEMIHCSSLVLDDIVDNSILRRGEPCSHHVHGVSLAGNGSLASTFYAFSLIDDVTLPLSDYIRLKLYEMVYWEHYGCSIGTALDLKWSNLKLTAIDHDQYIQHIVYRSCAYTYRVALRAGCIAAGAAPIDQEALFNYGTLTGIAFQFIDDILNLKPGTSSWGKTIGEDITAGKRSPLVLHTIKAANRRDKKRLLKILDSNCHDERLLQEAIAIMDSYNAFEEIRSQATRYIASACDEVDKLSISADYKSLLRDFAFYVVERRV
ncbi:MAG TPA: polyprenyl synthetase family protein [Cyclobacteriaceae bacterium]|jgi:geranylgeranyl pyrophosphate synthase